MLVFSITKSCQPHVKLQLHRLTFRNSLRTGGSANLTWQLCHNWPPFCSKSHDTYGTSPTPGGAPSGRNIVGAFSRSFDMILTTFASK